MKTHEKTFSNRNNNSAVAVGTAVLFSREFHAPGPFHRASNPVRPAESLELTSIGENHG